MPKKILFLFPIFILLFSASLRAQSSAAPRVGLANYEVISPEKADYLQAVVRENLQNALSDTRLEILSDVRDPSKTLIQKNWDALLIGSILKVGTPIQINSRLYLRGQEMKTFSDQADNADQLLAVLKKHGERLRQSIKAPITVTPIAPPSPTPVESPLPNPPGQEKTKTILRTPLSNRPLPAPETPKDVVVNPDAVWMSDRLSFEARGMAAANLFGDANAELILIDLNKIYVYEFVNRTLKLWGTYEGKGVDRFIHVSAQDVDGDAKPEILVSNIRYGQASSLVLKVQEDHSLKLLADQVPWLMKSVSQNGQNSVMGETFFGQERNRHSLKKLKFENGKMKEDGDWNVPSDWALFGLKASENSSNLAYMTPSGTLKVYEDKSGKVEKIWTASEDYGNSANFINLPVRNVLNQEEAQNTFFTQDPLIWKNEKGEIELLVGKNDTFLKNVVGTRPLFKNAWLVKIKESKVGLREEWSSQKIDGAVVDLIPYPSSEKGLRQVLALFWLRDKGLTASLKSYPSVLALYEVK